MNHRDHRPWVRGHRLRIGDHRLRSGSGDRRLWIAISLLAVVGLGLAGCGRSRPADDTVKPAQLKSIPGTSLHDVILTPQAMQDLGIRTQPVRSVPPTTAAASPAPASTAPRPRALTVIPLDAVVYDPQGHSWTYTTPSPRTFTRKPIVIDHIDGHEAFLRSGPPAGTPVVTVGAPELLGAEYGVGEE